jgi:hypothetical protein
VGIFFLMFEKCKMFMRDGFTSESLLNLMYCVVFGELYAFFVSYPNC